MGTFPVAGVKILGATVSESAGRWFVALSVEQEVADPTPRTPHVVGVDVGINHLAVTSDGELFENPKALSKAQKTLRIRQKAVSRKIKGSNNRRKAVARVARVHYRIANVRRDAIHKMTTAITKQASVIVIEDLNVAGMLKNRRLARSLSDASLSETHRQLKYKATWNGSELLQVDRYYPSSRRCSGCGTVKESLSLSDRTYRCEHCGIVIDRDLNAAINLKLWPHVAAASACRPGGSGVARKSKTKPLVGQEPSRKESAC